MVPESQDAGRNGQFIVCLWRPIHGMSVCQTDALQTIYSKIPRSCKNKSKKTLPRTDVARLNYHGIEDVVGEDLDEGEDDPEREEPPRALPPLQRSLPPLQRHVGEPAEARAGEAEAAAQQQRAQPRAQHPQHHPRQQHRLPDAARHHQFGDLFCPEKKRTKRNKTTRTTHNQPHSFHVIVSTKNQASE